LSRHTQFEIIFSESYISHSEAEKKLGRADETSSRPLQDQAHGELADYRSIEDEGNYDSQGSEPVENYERLILKGRPFLCPLPRTDEEPTSKQPEAASKVDQEKDLVTAADRGWELLQDLEGKCMFFVSGWWSYSFCYNSQIKQFHQLPPGSGGPIYPPQEDPSTPSYVLGKFDDKRTNARESGTKTSVTTELQTKGETRYLVQKLGGGTACDLTGKERRVEVQFHCHPQSTDRIGWIKEVATCTYLMIIYTPRLCNDVAFLPPRQNKAHMIACREILMPEEVPEWVKRKSVEIERSLVERAREAPLVAGNVEIGAMKEVGREGRRIQKGKVVSPPEEKAEMVAMQKNGRLQRLSKEDLRKLDLNPDTVEAFRKEIQDLAGTKDWKVEKVDDERGITQLRGVVAGDDEEPEEGGDRNHDKDDQGKEGSEEAYMEDI
jgi:Glucosidase II beta subunit-like protein